MGEKMELWIAFGSLIVAIISALFAWQQKKIAIAAKEIAVQQTAIAEASKDASLRSAKASEDSAETAKMAVGEGFRPLLQVYTMVSKNENDLLDLARLSLIYPELNGFPVYSLFLTNIGNRQCKNIQIQVKPALIVLNSNRFAETSSKVEKSIFFEDFLNVNQSICLNKDAKYIAVNDANTLVNFTIFYEDLTGTSYKPIEFQASLDALREDNKTNS